MMCSKRVKRETSVSLSSISEVVLMDEMSTQKLQVIQTIKVYAITQKSKPLSSLNGLQYLASLYRRTAICAFLHASRVIRRLLELPLKLICIFKNVLRYYEQLPNINSSRRNCCEIRYAGDVLITE